MDQTSFLSHCASLLRSTAMELSGSRARARKPVFPFGPVDALEDRVLLSGANDFGDAPAPYPVTLAEDGARHAAGGPTLGLTISTEADGIHSAAADADDATDDGVIFGQVVVGRTDNTVVVKVRNAAIGTRLDAWIDFNGDGNWDDAGEQVFDSVRVLNNTDQTLTFQVPGDAVLGTTFARFRISSAGGLSPTGVAPDGEVEDHQVQIGLAAPTVTSPAASSRVNVTRTKQVTFRWAPAAQATSYEIWVSSHTYQAQDEFHRAIVTGTSYTPEVDFGIGRYTVWMRSFGDNNEVSGWSTGRDFTVIAKTTITPMEKLQDTPRPEISWEPVLGARSYRIWLSNLSTDVPVLRKGGLRTTTFTPPSSLPLANYRVWIAAIAPKTFGGWSRPVDFVAAPAPVLQSINPTLGSNTYQWSSVPGATSYEFELRNLSSGETVLSETIEGTSWTPGTVLFSGVKYRWWVRAESAQGVFSRWSPGSDFFAGGQTDLLTPTGTSSDTTPTFTWRAVEGAVRYQLLVHRVDEFAVALNKRDILTNSYTATAELAPGTYRAWVRAFGASNTMTTWSLPITFTIAETEPATDDAVGIPQLLAEYTDEPPSHASTDADHRNSSSTPEADAGRAVVEQSVERIRDEHAEPVELAQADLSGDSGAKPTPMIELIDIAISYWVNRPADAA